MRRRSATILGTLALTNLVAYAARNSLFTVYPALRDRFGLHDAKLGLLTTAFLIPHALATLPFGWAGDRYDRRRVIALGMLLASIAGAAGAFARNTEMLVASRMLVGFGTAAVVPVANSILGQIYDGPKKASRMAIFNLGLLAGGVTGFGVGLAVGFPAVVVVLAVPGAILAVVVAVLPVPPQPGVAAPAVGTWSQIATTFIAESRVLWRIRTLRWLILSTTAMAFAAGGYNAWLIDFLERDKGMTSDEATRLLSIAMIGAVAGILTGGRVSDRLRARHPAGRLWTIAIGMTASVPCAVAAIELPAGALLYVAGLATMFFMFWYHAPMAVSVDDLAPSSHTAAAQGLVIFVMHLFGTASASYVLGLVSDATSIYVAMWVPTGALALAIGCMVAATPSFAADATAARARDATSS